MLLAKLLENWAAFCIKYPQPIIAGICLVAVVGFFLCWWTWSPYIPFLSHLPPNYSEKEKWENLSHQIHFDSEIMIRVTAKKSATSQQTLVDAIETLKQKLVAEKKLFCDILTSYDLQNNNAHDLTALPSDALLTLYYESLDAKQITDGQWALLETANYADWLCRRLQQSQNFLAQHSPQTTPTTLEYHQIFLQNQRLMKLAARFVEGLHNIFTAPSYRSNDKTNISLCQLNPDEWLNIANDFSFSSRTAEENPTQPLTGVIWLRVSGQENNGIRIYPTKNGDVFSNPEDMRRIDTAIRELGQITAGVSQSFPAVEIQLTGIAVDWQRQQLLTSERSIAVCLFGMAGMLLLFFFAGLGRFFAYLTIPATTLCSFGIYLFINAICFGHITPPMIFIGIAVLLFGTCVGVLLTITYFNSLTLYSKTSEAVTHVFRTIGKTVLGGGIISLLAFFAGIVYLQQFPMFDPVAERVTTQISQIELHVSFFQSLTGISQSLFLLTVAVIATLAGMFIMFPALLQTLGSMRAISTQTSNVATKPFVIVKKIPNIPLPLNLILTTLFVGGMCYFVFYPQHQREPLKNAFAQRSDLLPIFISQEQYHESMLQSTSDMLICHPFFILGRGSDEKIRKLEQIAPILNAVAMPPEIPLPDPKMLEQSLGQLYHFLTERLMMLQTQQILFLENQDSQYEISICRKICAELNAIQQQMRRLSSEAYFQCIHTYQTFTTNDLILQQKRLLTAIQMCREKKNELRKLVSRRFIDTEQHSIYWAFPICSQSNSTLLLKRFQEQISRCITTPEDRPIQIQGLPLLAIEEHRFFQNQLVAVASVSLIVVLLSMMLVFRSLKIAVVAALITITGLAFYRGLIGAIEFPTGVASVFPIAFFPLLLPVFLGMFFQQKISCEQLRTNVSILLICFGVGIAITGQFLFAEENTLFTVGRVLTLGWVGLMFPLLVNVICFVKTEKTQLLPKINHRHSLLALTSKHSSVTTSYEPISPPNIQSAEQSDKQQENKPQTFPQEKPASFATRDQLQFYRERIAATRIFEKQFVKQNAEQQPVARKENEGHTKTTTVLQNPVIAEFIDVPSFPSVWSIGSKQRTPLTIVTEDTRKKTSDDASKIESAISCGSLFRNTTYANRINKISLKNNPAHCSFHTASSEEIEELPVILPIIASQERENQSNDNNVEFQNLSANSATKQKFWARM
jgi:predicted RND superfamily exporter protein